MVYVPRGFSPNELGDIEVVSHEGRLHLFHLVLPSHDRIAHLVSDDGLRWARCPDALRTGRPGSFDDDMLWTMSVTRHDGRFCMLYTALSTTDGGTIQRIGRATSDDLVHWTRDEAPVSEPDATYYEDGPGPAPWASWRDPKPTATADGWATLLCARAKAGPSRRRGVVGHLASTDLLRFEARPALMQPHRYYELECPQMFELGGHWFLTASVIDDRSQRWWVADAPTGPWRTPPANRLLAAGHYAARVFRWRDETAVLGWFRGADGRGAVLSPQILGAEHGRLRCTPWPAWDALGAGPSRPMAVALRPVLGNPHARAETDALTSDAGLEVWASHRAWTGVRIDAEVRGDAGLFGLAVGLDDEGHGWFVELDPAERRCRLVWQGPGRDDRGRPWFSYRVQQEAPWAGSTPARVGLRAVDDEIELCIDGLVVLSALVPLPHGRAGAFVDSGRLVLGNATLTPIRSPAT